MYFYVDESGNTGLNLFDKNQPYLYYGLLGCTKNLDIVGTPLLTRLRRELNVDRLHANQLGVGRLVDISAPLQRFLKSVDARLSVFRVTKADHAVISFFDQVFDSEMNDAVPDHYYWTPLRFILLLIIAPLFDLQLAAKAWDARREQNADRCAKMLIAVCTELQGRVDGLADLRSREIIHDALEWAKRNPKDISYGASNRESALQMSPNLVGFQQVIQGIATESTRRGRVAKRITVDRQTEFNAAQQELAQYYQAMRKLKQPLGPGMPVFDGAAIPETSPVFMPGDESAGLELVDIGLWLAKRFMERRELPAQLQQLFLTYVRRGITDQISIDGIRARWQHLAKLPEPDAASAARAKGILDEAERNRLNVLKSSGIR